MVGGPTADRVVAAARECLAERGLRRTTVDDVAAAAGVSRATLYRAFPGGRDTILQAVLDAERAALRGVLAAAIATSDEIGGALVAGYVAATRWLADHEVLERLMFEEPATVLTHLEFEQFDHTLAAAVAAFADLLERFVGRPVAERLTEWSVRLVVSYLLFPDDDVDLSSEEGARTLVARHVLPGLAVLGVTSLGCEPPGATSPTRP